MTSEEARRRLRSKPAYRVTVVATHLVILAALGIALSRLLAAAGAPKALSGIVLLMFLLLAFGAVGTVVVCGLILNLEANERTRLPIDLEGQREFNREFLADLARPFSWWKR